MTEYDSLEIPQHDGVKRLFIHFNNLHFSRKINKILENKVQLLFETFLIVGLLTLECGNIMIGDVIIVYITLVQIHRNSEG